MKRRNFWGLKFAIAANLICAAVNLGFFIAFRHLLAAVCTSIGFLTATYCLWVHDDIKRKRVARERRMQHMYEDL